MTENNDIINSLKRLERIGSEASKTTEKLKESVVKVATRIIKKINEAYDVDSWHIEVSKVLPIAERKDRKNDLLLVKTPRVTILCYRDEFEDTEWSECGYNLAGFQIASLDFLTRERALRFAADIANGLLDEINKKINQYRDEATILVEEAEKVLV